MFEIKIPVSQKEGFLKSIEKLNRRADKIGVERISFSFGEEVVEKRNVETYEAGEKVFKKVSIRFTPVFVEGVTPVYAGWKLIAQFEYVKSDHSKVIKTLAEDEIPSSYLEKSEPFCDHCQTHRVKKYTFLIKKVESGEFKLVGKGCLKDFINKEISRIVSWFTSVEEMFATYMEGGGFSYEEREFNTLNVLAFADASIRRDGYRKADEMYSSKEEAVRYFKGRMTREELDDLPEMTEGNKENAQKVINWVMKQNATGEYMTNLQVLLSDEYCSAKFFGFIISSVSVYITAMAKEAIRREFLNEYVGEIKKRQKFNNVTILYTKPIDSYYGTSILYTMIDDQNHKLNWFCSGVGLEADDGDTVDLVGTVKDHKEFNGTKTTYLNRVKMV